VNLASIFDDHPHDRTALVSGGDRITYGQLSHDAATHRGVLVELGLQPGDRVAVLCGTNRRFVTAWFGIIGAGLVAVPLNPLSPAAEIERELLAVGARAVIVGPAGVAALESIDRSALPNLEFVLRPAGVELEGSLDLDARREATEPLPVVDGNEDDPAVMLFTSGTAGAPKTAMLTHGNLASNLRQSLGLGGKVMRPDDVVLGVVPLFHIMGLNAVLNMSLLVGATLVLQERFDPMTVFQTVAEERITVMLGPPTMWSALSQIDVVPDSALSTLRVALSGSAMLPDRVTEEILGRFGVRVLERYGLTEASSTVCMACEDDVPVGSVGRPLPGLEMRVVDATGADVDVVEPGEIWVRGPNVFSGYFNDPEATAAALDADGWLHTGDVAVLDDDGYVYLVDRIKDLIIVSGFNVFPAEVERALLTYPGVREAAAVGVAHPHTGESVKAFVVVEQEGLIEEDELIEWCAGELARYKCPTKVDFVDEIPTGFGGKILRRSLAE
jgi:long-chain acyl-CoA synthetase